MGKTIQKTSKGSKNTTVIQGNPLKKYYYIFGLLAFFLFVNTLGNGYNMDDAMVTMNHQLTSKGLSAIGEIFTSNYYSDAAGYAYGYRPIVHLSFAIEHDLFGEKPSAGHFINVILFVFSVILFFKLLVKWVGEKNILFAAIATLLFIVHPIHTEVVASLKNRDEIFAFLFVVWAGLKVFKYIEKGTIVSLLMVFFLFTLAMLSKKSVYPMVLVLPMAMILLKDLSLKQLALISLALIIPAAIIGSELQMERMLLLLLAPLAIILITYLVKSLYLSEQPNELLLKYQWMIPVLFNLILVSAAYYFSSIYLVIATIPFLIWTFHQNFKIGLISILVVSYGSYLLYQGEEFLILPIIAATGFMTYLWYKKEKFMLWMILSIVTIIIPLVLSFQLSFILIALSAILFFGLLFKYMWLGLIPFIIVLIINIVTKSFANPHLIYVFGFIICWLIFQKTQKKLWINYTPVIAFFITILFVSNATFQYNKSQENLNGKAKIENTLSSNLETASDKNNSLKESSILKEGRELLYVENTLIAPHSKNETLATGFETLGEYMRLHIFPKDLSFYYGFATLKTVNLTSPFAIISLLFHLFLIGIAIWQLKRRPFIAIGLVWYLSSILLFSNWIELVAGMVGERLAFTASAGFCILITAVVFWINPNFSLKKPGALGTVLGIALVLLAGRTIVRNSDWKSELSLMSHDIKHLGNSSQANNLYARTLMKSSIEDKSLTQNEKLEMQRTAISHFDKATDIWPDFYNVYIDKARATMLTGDYDEGLKALEKAARVQPENTLSYFLFLEIAEKKVDFTAYLSYAKRLLTLSKTDMTYGYVARGYFFLNDFPKSKEFLLQGLKEFPTSEVLKSNLAVVEQKTN